MAAVDFRKVASEILEFSLEHGDRAVFLMGKNDVRHYPSGGKRFNGMLSAYPHAFLGVYNEDCSVDALVGDIEFFADMRPWKIVEAA